MPRYAQVIIDIAHADVDRLFTYEAPEGMALKVGSRVSVPFGRQTKEGYILGFSGKSGLDPSRIRPILEPLEDYPALLPALIELAREISLSAQCPMAECLRLMLPAEMRGGRVKVKTETAAQLLLSGEALDKARAAQGRSAKRRLLIDLMADGVPHPVSELSLLARSPLPALRELEKQGVARLFDRELLRSPYPDAPVPTADPTLTAAQQEALGEILPGLRRREGAFLLHGVTGSGKTEVHPAVRGLKLGLGPSCWCPRSCSPPDGALVPRPFLMRRRCCTATVRRGAL